MSKVQKRKPRKAVLKKLKLKQYIEFLVASNDTTSKEKIKLSESRIVRNCLVQRVLIELKLTEVVKNNSTNFMPIHLFSKQLEEVLYNELSKHDEYKKYIKSSAN